MYAKIRAGNARKKAAAGGQDIFYDPVCGTVFREGKIYVFSRSKILVLRPWVPAGWQKTRRKPYWRNCLPVSLVQVPDPLHEPLDFTARESGQPAETLTVWEHQDLAWRRFYDQIPMTARRAIYQFPSRQFHLLSFVARCGDAGLQLVQGNPALSFCLANQQIFVPRVPSHPMRTARTLLSPGRKLVDIAEHTGFAPEKRIIRLLRKVPHATIKIANLLSLRSSLRLPGVVEILANLPALPRPVLWLAKHSELLALVAPPLLHELAELTDEEQFPGAGYLCRDVYRMIQQGDGDLARFGRIRSLKRLKRMHEDHHDQVLPPARCSDPEEIESGRPRTVSWC